MHLPLQATGMFRRLRDDQVPMVALTVDGEPCSVPAGAPVAAALLQRGSIARTTAASASPRAPYCMMGVCFECLVRIDGRPNCQSCLVIAEEGMQVRSQHGHRAADNLSTDER
jgi:predicted molibdopterin-dependent oxidoreductase YjgC